MYYQEIPNNKLECLIENDLIKYDALSRNSLEVAKTNYEPNFMYIGSSRIYYVNGVKQISDEDLHFFVKVRK